MQVFCFLKKDNIVKETNDTEKTVPIIVTSVLGPVVLTVVL